MMKSGVSNRSLGLCVGAGLLLLAGCVHVQPVQRAKVDPLAVPDSRFWTLRAEQSGISVWCRPLPGQDDGLRYIDADLSDTPVLPFFLLIRNDRDTPISFDADRFSLQTGDYRGDAAGFDDVRPSILAGSRSTAYSAADLAALEASFRPLLLAGGEIPAGGQTWGLLFFQGNRPAGMVQTLRAQLLLQRARIEGRDVTLPFILQPVN